MLIEEANKLFGFHENYLYYYVSGYGRDIRKYIEDFGYNIYDYRKYLLYVKFVDSIYLESALHDDIFGYMNTIRSIKYEYNGKESNILKMYFKPDIHESIVKLNNKDCILIYPEYNNENLWFIWQPSEDSLDFVEYGEDEYNMPDIKISNTYEKRYGEINPKLLKLLKERNK